MSTEKKTAILCVDDERMILQSLELQLSEHFRPHHLLEFAESAEEGLEILDSLHDNGVKVLAIVSDWLMPGMKGDEFLITAHRKFPYIIKILLTGFADEKALEKVKKEADLYTCIRKPWTSEELIKVLDAALGAFDIPEEL